MDGIKNEILPNIPAKTLEEIKLDLADRRSKILTAISSAERETRNEILDCAAQAADRMGAWAEYLRDGCNPGEKTWQYWEGYRIGAREIAGVIRSIIFHGLKDLNTAGMPLTDLNISEQQQLNPK